MFCPKCGNELAENTGICMGCGCEVKEVNVPNPDNLESKPEKKRKAKRLWVILGAAVFVLAVLVVFLFMPRNLKMNDFTSINYVSAIIQFGIPEDINIRDDGTVSFIYGDKHTFYGITPYGFVAQPGDGSVAFFFDEDVQSDVYRKINRYCEWEENLLQMFSKFSYKDLEITTNYCDGSYVQIEAN